MYDLSKRIGERTPSRRMSSAERKEYLASTKQKDLNSSHIYHEKIKINRVDPDGAFVWIEHEAVFGFGKYKGKQLMEIARVDKGYLRWILTSDFSSPVKKIIESALNGGYPVFQADK